MALDAETIQQLHNTLRALPRPLLESLTRAFRKRFQVPDTAVTIADRINQKCHPLCIIKCYLQLVSRQDWSFPLSASPFRLIASPPVVALLGLFAIP